MLKNAYCWRKTVKISSASGDLPPNLRFPPAAGAPPPDTSVVTSGVARVPCALGQEIFLRLPSTKLSEFELKNRCKNAEEVKVEHLL